MAGGCKPPDLVYVGSSPTSPTIVYQYHINCSVVRAPVEYRYRKALYGVRSIMVSTAVCGTASESSILSVPTIHMGLGPGD